MKKFIFIFLFLSFGLIGCSNPLKITNDFKNKTLSDGQNTQLKKNETESQDIPEEEINYTNIKKIGCVFGADDKNLYLLYPVGEGNRRLLFDGPGGEPRYYDDEVIKRGFVISKIIDNISPKSFKILLQNGDLCYAANDKSVFYYTPLYPYLHLLNNAEVDSFQILEPNIFSRDKDNIFFFYQNVQGANPNTFEILNKNNKWATYAKDNSRIYFFDNIIKTISYMNEVDLDTFEQIPQNFSEAPPGTLYAKDKNNIYYREKKIANADLTSFMIVGGLYSKDKNKVYCAGRMLVNADADTFVYETFQFKDKNKTYFNTLCIP